MQILTLSLKQLQSSLLLLLLPLVPIAVAVAVAVAVAAAETMRKNAESSILLQCLLQKPLDSLQFTQEDS